MAGNFDEKTLETMFDKTNEKINFSNDEASRFKKAFEDPKFREMFAEYMNEIQDPKYREETEAYISQLEGEDKVPEGKELIRPVACYVAKTYKATAEDKFSNKTGSSDDDKEKVFINIVQSDRIAKPTSTKGADGSHWQIPYSVGPLRMEKDKKESNATAFDVCFHPEAIALSLKHKQFQTVVVETAIDGIEAAYQRQKQNTKLSRDFHIIKNVTYKSGQAVTMMINKSDSKSSWSDDNVTNTTPVTTTTSNGDANNTKASNNSADTNAKIESDGAIPNPGSKHTTVVKKGFLNNQKSYVYDEELKNKDESSSASNKLVQELPSNYKPLPKSYAIASAPKEETLLKPVSTSAKTKNAITAPSTATIDDSNSNSNKEPVYTMKERGVLTMGDFEGMRGNNKVASNRPAELIYRFDVPLAMKPSLLNLDVSERLLKLSYPEIYGISLPLPYPVFDKKGTAKYDKASKSLTVTLPVQPHQQVVISTPTIATSTNDSNDDEISSVPTTATTKTNQKGSIDGSHARWVSANVTDEAKLKNEELKSDIKKKAEEAIKLYSTETETTKIVPPPPVVDTPKDRIPPAPVTTRTHPLLESNDDFIPSNLYVGPKNGHVFKTGSKGLGYYIDGKEVMCAPPPPPPTTTAYVGADTSSVDKINTSIIPYAARQNISTLAIIIEIKGIDKSTVEVIYDESKLDVCVKDLAGLVHEIGFDIVGGIIDTKQSSHDIAPENMVIVLVKSKEQYWAEPVNNSNCSTILIQRNFSKASTLTNSIIEKSIRQDNKTDIISNMTFNASTLYELD